MKSGVNGGSVFVKIIHPVDVDVVGKNLARSEEIIGPAGVIKLALADHFSPRFFFFFF